MLTYSLAAQQDLHGIFEYIAADNTETARQFIDRLTQRCAAIAHAPYMGRPRDEIRPGLRSVPFGRYLIFYMPSDPGVTIVRVYHSARQIEVGTFSN